ncbi:MAG: hypothetical protein COV52_06455 [Gammaproteobacteria bacterium CG11_big_fil_rev_8_21_14_0_20_46_22]|nr:MAG: hypothetical protein COW05_07210 [Gammaproteobacteria bacterium CG12_big_fil_rev_8_21_14_0_65_46_12]PIR11140.1 MAG: hypothetical protein COV52_06455 [Gammaproteobacteria bacterium CG11_big_fil_rev_8_21_14_0_20_46_22]
MKATLVKKYWKDVREEMQALAPEFSNIVDALNPGDDLCFYEGVYPYGAEVVKQGVLQVANPKGDIVPYNHPTIETHLSEDLSYNLGSNPCLCVLESCLEAYTYFDDRVIPACDYLRPGSFSGIWQVLGPQVSQYPEFLWNLSSGSRSIFMLPKVSEANANNKLKRAFSLTTNKPRSMLDHWYLFREMASHPDFPKPWRSRVLFFSGEWFKQLEDPAWHEFQRYILKKAWFSSEFWRNQFVWNIVFSSVQKNRQIKSSAHIINTVQHLIIMAAGFMPGFAPALDDSAAPVSSLQQVYLDIYNLRNYAPILMQPHCLSFEDNARPVYYSLHYPTAGTFSPKSSGHSSTISDLYEVKMIMDKYLMEMRSGNIHLSDTLIAKTAEAAAFSFFHSDTEMYHDVKPSEDIPKEDPSFKQATPKNTISDEFPNNSSFVRGCIRVDHYSK